MVPSSKKVSFGYQISKRLFNADYELIALHIRAYLTHVIIYTMALCKLLLTSKSDLLNL